MSKYIDADKLKKAIEEKGLDCSFALKMERLDTLALVDSLQQEQPIEGKQVIIITETDGDANIHWDCRSLDDVKALLASAQSFIADKQVEELRGEGSGPDYNTTEGRFRNAHKFQQKQPEIQNGKFVFPKYLYARTKDNKTIDMSYVPQDMTAVEYIRKDFVEQEQPEVDLEKEIEEYCGDRSVRPVPDLMEQVARHFYELGLNARKEN